MEFIRANADEVRRCAALKGEPAPVDEILELDRRWREATTQAESTRRSSSVGCLLLAGGISLACSRSATWSHSSTRSSAAESVSICSRSRPAFRLVELWHSKQ